MKKMNTLSGGHGMRFPPPFRAPGHWLSQPTMTGVPLILIWGLSILSCMGALGKAPRSSADSDLLPHPDWQVIQVMAGSQPDVAIFPLLAQVKGQSTGDDIRVMPDGTRKKRCPACGEYHIDVPPDAPQPATPLPIMTPPVTPLPPVQDGSAMDAGVGLVSGTDGISNLPDESDEIATTVTNAVGTALVTGMTALGAGLMMLGMGVTPREVVEGVQELFTSSPPQPSPEASVPLWDDEFERWKQDFSSRGWSYSEKDGVAEFEPVEGATNESGWTYSQKEGAFLPPGKGEPQPDVPASDTAYREEVRLLQEDLERQRDLLDREQERLRHYEQAGLAELVPGSRERIREYEKLTQLNQRELDRLGEDRPVHTVEENQDLAAETGERLRTKETFRQLNESEARSDEIQGRLEVEAAREASTREAEALVSQNLPRLEERMKAILDEKTQEGYFVRNSNLPKKAWNNTLGRAVEWAGGWKGGQCGEYGQWGMDWSKDAVHELFGQDAVVTDIAASNNPFLGHRATKVILPDGQRLVLDYWESMPSGSPKIYPENQWIEQWDKKLMGNILGRVEVDRHPDELLLKSQIENFGEEAGVQKFRSYFANRGQAGHAETFIRSWGKNPW